MTVMPNDTQHPLPDPPHPFRARVACPMCRGLTPLVACQLCARAARIAASSLASGPMPRRVVDSLSDEAPGNSRSSHFSPHDS